MNMINLLVLLITLLISNSAYSSTGKVMIDSLSVRNSPNGEITNTIDINNPINFKNSYENWINNRNGWINSDFIKIDSSRTFLFTEKIECSIAIIKNSTTGETLSGKVSIPDNSGFPIVTEKGNFIIIDKNNVKVAVKKNRLEIKRNIFKSGIVLKNGTLISEDGKTLLFIKKGTPFIKIGNIFLIKNRIGNFLPTEQTESYSPPASELTSKINLIIDTFNSARISSAITERLGYFPKVLPISPSNIHIVNMEEGKKGIYVSIKYIFYDLNGSSIKNRKTRLVLKRGNEAFWEKLSKEIFSSSKIIKFTQLHILRYNGKGNFEKKGFIATGITAYKNGACDLPPGKFMEKTESELSEDLWFFANEVYERIENGD